MHDQYIFSGSLPDNASTYVKREADDELYEALIQGKFCYVLNSRQSGKSSLRVRTMSRLGEAGIECAAIDLSSISIQTATQENWYADLIIKLIDSFVLDVDFKSWWEQNQLNSPLLRFGNFLTKILLSEISENIVIFIDEIDSVLSLNFPTDDFFAFIRYCYNERVDNPQYNRLTFCLLGVVSPTSLIQDKQRTPFNIGKAISLKGFQLHEAEPLEKGLQGKFNNPQAVIQEILQWTGGQPFLTQKLCQFMVEESEQENPRSVEQVVRSRIIESWESQDEPEHLRTIQARILRDEQRAGYLLELYHQVRLAEERSLFIADDTLEQSELQLSGLVVRQQGKLRIYNQIYREIFDSSWIENQLNNLRPYSENFRFWVASGGADESRLLRGKALESAEEWARDKNIIYQDKQFLAASKEKEIQEEIAAKEQEAALKREKKDREAAEDRNQLLSEANKKAQRRIGIGIFVLVATVLGAAVLGASVYKQVNETKKEVEAVQKLNKLAGELQNYDNSSSEELTFSSNEALRLSALSFNINNHQLKQALVLSTRSQAYQQLKKLKNAKQENNQSQKLLDEADKKALSSIQGLQVQVLFYKSQGDLQVKNNENSKAMEPYRKAFIILKDHPNQTDFTKENQLLTGENIESVHRSLIKLNPQNKELKKQIEDSLTQHLYAQLGYFLKAKNWESADELTYRLMINIAKSEEEGNLDFDNIKNFSCPDIQKINQLWVSNSDKRFGFSVQKEIWIRTNNKLGLKLEDFANTNMDNYLRFAKTVGWYDAKKAVQGSTKKGEWVSNYGELLERIKNNPKIRGSFPQFRPIYYTKTYPGVRRYDTGVIGMQSRIVRSHGIQVLRSRIVRDNVASANLQGYVSGTEELGYIFFSRADTCKV
ncbi:AAA-like domain-containing protein [Anabaena sp. UHCC 0399]|uniref:AAA-like domain-containing protein n=1 Tax=Anabaena sp. UHCC 0399 TaxID=3110238 RepID=UPI002B1FC324|nr:AAA-like domain-containing protein [Anabaena sp. UHCC 0399]MEA5567786.1 AAA-like domain-containing protein [Anabaena sp. UHCC 0399]